MPVMDLQLKNIGFICPGIKYSKHLTDEYKWEKPYLQVLTQNANV